MALVVEIDGVRYPEGTRLRDASGDVWEFVRQSQRAPVNTTSNDVFYAYPSIAQDIADVYGPLTPEVPSHGA